MEYDLTSKFMFHPAFKLALEEAKNSNYYQRVGAVIFKGKRIVSSAHNAVRSNSVKSKFKQFHESLHAEASAIIKARKNLKGYSIIVVRLSKNNELALAKPCEFCQEYIEYVGITNIFYTTNEGKILCMKE